MRVSLAIAVAAVIASPLASSLHSQARDSLQLGDRVRVRVASSRGPSTFVGNVASISPDTLVVSIPGDKGSIILPRLAIAEVALSDGRVSRLRANGPIVATLLLPATLFVESLRRPHLPNSHTPFLLAGVTALTIGHAISRTPPERWRPVFDWLEGR